jgi:murein DD-endopeptidase MepM/ murein hydrolase activator NlpD
MQLIITDAWLAKSRAFHLSGTKLALAGLGISLALILISASLYHWVLLKGARDGWPVIGPVVRWVVKDEFAQRDRYMRENIEVMAKKLGEMQAKLLQLESLGERVSGLAGVNPADIKTKPGQGGTLVLSRDLSMLELQTTLNELDQVANQRADVMTVIESRLFEQKVKKMMVPTQAPVVSANLGSSFGWRIDPITGLSALHTGLDFPAEPGTPIFSAAGGVVVTQDFHAQYGNMVEIDHGNDLISRYAHASKVFVKKGDLVKRGQKIAEVGTTGRSTGPHLHFEVLVQGVPQDPQKFLNAGRNLAALPAQVAKALVPTPTVSAPAAAPAVTPAAVTATSPPPIAKLPVTTVPATSASAAAPNANPNASPAVAASNTVPTPAAPTAPPANRAPSGEPAVQR